MSRGHHQIKVGFDVMYSHSGGFGQEFGGGYLDGRFQINPLYETIPIATLITYNPALAPPGSPAGSTPIARHLRSRLAIRITASTIPCSACSRRTTGASSQPEL